MKIYVLVLFSSFAISCAKQNSKTEIVDTTKQTIDSIKTEALPTEQSVKSIEPAEPPIDSLQLTAPAFEIYFSAVSDDKREKKVLNAFSNLVSVYKKQKYVSIKKSLLQADPVMPGNTSEDETWYFNDEREPCVLISTYKSERTTSSIFYLIENQSVVGAHTSTQFGDTEGTYSTAMLLVSILCPRCGISLSDDDGSGYQLEELDETSVRKCSNEFINKYEDMRKSLEEANLVLKTDKEYQVNVMLNSDTIKYSIDLNLASKFLKK